MLGYISESKWLILYFHKANSLVGKTNYKRENLWRSTTYLVGEPDQFNSINLLSTYYIRDSVLSAQEISVHMTDMDSFLIEIPCLVGKEDIRQALQMRETQMLWEKRSGYLGVFSKGI